MHKTWPTLFIPHGGGPCFFMEWDPPDTWVPMEQWLRQLGTGFATKPKAIVVISAHWEEDIFTVTSHPQPHLIYDYSGFPPHTYELTYPAPGSPALAARIQTLLNDADIPARQDSQRGFDHGVFIPLKVIYPDADIPIVQLSLKRGLDPEHHAAAGRALSSLRDDGVLIIGSGMSYHNLREFFKGGDTAQSASQQFEDWLDTALGQTSPEQRTATLDKWQQAPSARQAHPREEHLLPLMVVSAAAEKEQG